MLDWFWYLFRNWLNNSQSRFVSQGLKPRTKSAYPMPLSETSKRRLIWLAVVVAVLGVRTGWVLYDRSQHTASRPVPAKPTEKDYLTVIPKSYVTDLESAQKLVGKRLWVKAGYAAEYFRYSPSPRVGPRSTGSKFEPLEEITVQKVIEQPEHSPQKRRELLLLFSRGGEEFSTVIGYFDAESKQYQVLLDDLFYIKDPRELYPHWDERTWQRIKNHELEQGMTFSQVNLTLGVGTLVTMEAGGTQLYQFGRKPGGGPGKTRVRFVDGRVAEFEVRN
jgi:hypothetical protein